jgi:dTDP-4-dehydrorhamnose reductase
MRIAVTGSTGFVGSNIAAVLASFGHEVIGLTRRPVENLPWKAQLTDFSNVDALTASLVNVDSVVHCAIHNDFNQLVKDRDLAYDSFVGMTERVARAANANGTQMVYISTDWILDGTGHLMPETERGNPLNYYGFLKAMGEQVVRDLCPGNGAICRIAGVMGKHQLASDGPRKQDVGFGYFVYSLVEALQSDQAFTVWSGPNVNQTTSPSLAAEIGAQVERVITLKKAGTFHLVGDDAIDRFELAELVCEVFGLDSSRLNQDLPPESELFPAPVPKDSSLANAKTKEQLKLQATPLRGLLEAFKRELETGELGTLTKPIH